MPLKRLTNGSLVATILCSLSPMSYMIHSKVSNSSKVPDIEYVTVVMNKFRLGICMANRRIVVLEYSLLNGSS